MQKLNIFTIIILMGTINSTIAQKYDYQWIFGYGYNEEIKFGVNMLDFNKGKVDVSYYRESKAYDLGFTGAFIDNRQGEIILHTNNCEVRDTNWDVISGEELITPTGEVAVEACLGTRVVRYSAVQSSIFLPDLIDNNLIYLVHKDMEIDFSAQDAYSNNMWLSTIKETSGNFTYKKKMKISDDKKIALRLTACPNNDKSKWWILMPKNHSNEFDKYLIGNDTVIEITEQKIGEILNISDLDIGQAQFSPNGNMLGINSEKHGVLLYDFDNENGELSNFRKIPYPNSEQGAIGLCFSPNSRFVYVTTIKDVYQIDLKQGNEVYHVGHYSSLDDINWPVALGFMLTGPDCKIYVSPRSTTNYLHVILNPDEKGAECRFAERAIELPARVAHDFANLPQYRYLTGCDYDIDFPFDVSTIEEEIFDKTGFKIYPNPASEYIEVILTEMDKWRNWQIIDMTGRKMLKGIYQDMQKIDISVLKNGMYILKMRDKYGVERVERFVVFKG